MRLEKVVHSPPVESAQSLLFNDDVYLIAAPFTVMTGRRPATAARLEYARVNRAREVGLRAIATGEAAW